MAIDAADIFGIRGGGAFYHGESVFVMFTEFAKVSLYRNIPSMHGAPEAQIEHPEMTHPMEEFPDELQVAPEVRRIFPAVLCENYGGWRLSILSRFWRILGVLVFGMSVCVSMAIWNGFGIS